MQKHPTRGGLRLTTRLAGLAITVTTVIVSLTPASADAAAIRTGFDAATLPGNDDGSTGLVSLGFAQDVNFFGSNYSSLYVNNNGNVTFDAALSTFTPFGLSTTNRVIIAPFFADVDTRPALSLDVTYGIGSVGGRDAFGVNWIDVGYFSNSVDKLNSFQLVLIDRADIAAGDFDIEFNYDKIQWETGGASGGVDGLGGSSAAAGYANGLGTFDEIIGSNVNGALLDGGPNSLSAGGNTGTAGRYLFQVRNGQVILPPDPDPVPPGPGTPIPEAGNMMIGMLCLLIAALYRQRPVAVQ